MTLTNPDHGPAQSCDGLHVPTFVTLTYIPAGLSDPDERQYWFDWPRDEASITAFIARTRNAGEEPIEVRNPEGLVLWRADW